MKRARRVRLSWVMVVVSSLLVALPAAAQEPPAEAAPPPAEAAPPPPPPLPPAPLPPPPAQDGPRFRGGVSFAGGGAFVAGWGLGFAGVDGRLGVQLNNLIGIYAQPYFMLGYGERGTVKAFTGFAGATAQVDFTFLDRFFAGAGAGGAILNNPGAGELHVRLGAYPLFARGLDGVRRKGLMVGLDMRVYFASGFQIVNVMGGVGYEAY
jgi:hypothetical protein